MLMMLAGVGKWAALQKWWAGILVGGYNYILYVSKFSLSCSRKDKYVAGTGGPVPVPSLTTAMLFLLIGKDIWALQVIIWGLLGIKLS